MSLEESGRTSLTERATRTHQCIREGVALFGNLQVYLAHIVVNDFASLTDCLPNRTRQTLDQIKATLADTYPFFNEGVLLPPGDRVSANRIGTRMMSVQLNSLRIRGNAYKSLAKKTLEYLKPSMLMGFDSNKVTNALMDKYLMDSVLKLSTTATNSSILTTTKFVEKDASLFAVAYGITYGYYTVHRKCSQRNTQFGLGLFLNNLSDFKFHVLPLQVGPDPMLDGWNGKLMPLCFSPARHLLIHTKDRELLELKQPLLYTFLPANCEL